VTTEELTGEVAQAMLLQHGYDLPELTDRDYLMLAEVAVRRIQELRLTVTCGED
jgi:hypothetical protein